MVGYLILSVDMTLLLVLPRSQLELDEVPGTVVIDIVAGVDGGCPRLVIVDWDGGGGGAGGCCHCLGPQDVEEGRHGRVGLGRIVSLGDTEDHLHVVRGTESSSSSVNVSLC